MLKHIYRTIILICIFAGAIYYFGSDIKEEVFNMDKTITMSETSFPIITLKIGEQSLNMLHGYSNNIDANMIRESMLPLDDQQSFAILIDENENQVKRVIYELRSISDNKLLETDTINALEKEGDLKTAKVKFKQILEEETEYSVKLTLVTSESRRMNYYTRIKKINTSYYNEKLEFIMNFHNSLLDKEKAEEVIIYLEPNSHADNSSFSYVNINSSFELVTYGDLKPQVISPVIPTITEISKDLASVVLQYVASSTTEYGVEYYNVREHYRVRYTTSRIYLLNYERTMESIFDINNISLSKNELKLGITNNPDIDFITSSEDSKLAFVRERELWYYNLAENSSAVRVFSFKQSDTDYIRDNYDQHDIRILNMDDAGNISFLVYGYLNRGVYEGRVGIVLYQFYSGENRIEELVYIPINVPYQILKEEINHFSYLNDQGIFYFTMNENIYSYDLITKGLTLIANKVHMDNFVFCSELHYIALQDTSNAKEAKSIMILDLESGSSTRIESKHGSNIKLLGSIDNNIIYGYAYSHDITTNVYGKTLIPMYEIHIADHEGDVLKSYKKEDYYITDILVENNIITLERVTKANEGNKVVFVTASSDNILNKVKEVTKAMDITKRITDKTKTEYYISLPKGFVLEKKPKVNTTVNTVIYDDTTLRIEEGSKIPNNYIAYSYGRVVGLYDNSGEAISKANSMIGAVLDRNGRLLWERRIRSNSLELSTFDKLYVGGGLDSIMASAQMMINYRYGYNNEEMGLKDNKSLVEYLEHYFGDTILDLTGSSLEEVLYYVGLKRPVIAMKNSKEAVLIIGYDPYNITVVDPVLKRTMKIGLKDGTALFKEAGNIFYSYYMATK